MRKSLYLIAVASLLLSISLTSAYYYGGYYDDYNYHSSRSQGSYYGPHYSRTLDYSRTTDVRDFGYGGYERTTITKRTERVQPSYYSNYYWNYPRYYNYYPAKNYYYSWSW